MTYLFRQFVIQIRCNHDESIILYDVHIPIEGTLMIGWGKGIRRSAEDCVRLVLECFHDIYQFLPRQVRAYLGSFTQAK